jgi:hypothetical protein
MSGCALFSATIKDSDRCWICSVASEARDRRQTTASSGAHLTRGKQPTPPLVPLRAVRFPPQGFPVAHANAGSNQSGDWRSSAAESLRRSSEKTRFTYC